MGDVESCGMERESLLSRWLTPAPIPTGAVGVGSLFGGTRVCLTGFSGNLCLWKSIRRTSAFRLKPSDGDLTHLRGKSVRGPETLLGPAVQITPGFKLLGAAGGFTILSGVEAFRVRPLDLLL